MAIPQPVDVRMQPWRETPSGDLMALDRPIRRVLHLVYHNPAQGYVFSRRRTILLVLFTLTLHGAVIHWLSQQKTPVLPEVPPQVPLMTIEFTALTSSVVESPPSEPLPPVVEEPPPPVVGRDAMKPPPLKPVPKPGPKPRPQPQSESVPRAVEPTLPAPPQPVALPAPLAPLTLPSANAGYLYNPASEHPALAMCRGREGIVLLWVHVLASGSLSEIQVQKSDGCEALDQVVVKAVKRWSFVPVKRGDKAEDGWVSVPIDFKLS